MERGGVLGHFDERIVRHGRPIEQARHLPSRVACPFAGDFHDRGDQLMVPDAAIVAAGDGAQLYPPVIGFQRLHQLGSVRKQSVLHVDSSKRRGELPHIAGRCADQAAHLAERPVRRSDGLVAARDDQRQALGVVATCFDTDRARFDGAGGGSISPCALGSVKIAK